MKSIKYMASGVQINLNAKGRQVYCFMRKKSWFEVEFIMTVRILGSSMIGSKLSDQFVVERSGFDCKVKSHVNEGHDTIAPFADLLMLSDGGRET